MKNKNPFRIFFISLVVICCIILSVVFLYVSYVNEKAIQRRYEKEHAEVLIQDFEAQLNQMEDIAFQIASNYKMQPYCFMENIAKELDMLEALEQYQYYSALTKEYFYYYGTDRVYCSTGKTLAYDLFLKSKTDSEEEWNKLEEHIRLLLEGGTAVPNRVETFAVADNLYVLIPVRVRITTKMETAVIGFVVAESVLEERFEMLIGGKTQSQIVLYAGEEILYSAQNRQQSGKEAAIARTSDEKYTLYYCSGQKNSENDRLHIWVLLVLTDILLIFILANIFAEKAYRPIEALNDKYREKEAGQKYENGLEELKVILRNLHQNSADAESEIRKSRRLLREQILKMLLENVNVHEISTSLDQDELSLAGPFFCVVSICFEEKAEVTDEFMEVLARDLEELSYDNNYVYAICDVKKKLISVICSIYREEGKQELLEMIIEVAEGYGNTPVIGIGNMYQNIERISVSNLESIDDIYARKKTYKGDEKQYLYNARDLHKIVLALERGDEQAALEKLEDYMEKLQKNPISLLMQQCIMADFCSEIKQIGKKYQLELSKQNVGLLITAKTAEGLEAAFKKVIHDFCAGYEQKVKKAKDDEVLKICQYIETHFMEYELSLESVAAQQHTTTAMVRQAVLANTGKGYKDYVIWLRIEYAKKLLLETDWSVAVVCEKVGYGNISYFIKLFKETTGVTPAKYRKDVI